MEVFLPLLEQVEYHEETDIEGGMTLVAEKSNARLVKCALDLYRMVDCVWPTSAFSI